MQIKRAKFEQAEDVKYITEKTIREVYPHYYPKGAVAFFIEHHNVKNISEDIVENDVYLLYDEEQMVGTLTIKKNEINRLFVLPEFQRKGYGKLLLEFAENEIAKQYNEIVLDASLPAKVIYKKRGYLERETHSIKTDNEDYLCYDVMYKNKANEKYKIDYDQRCFIVKNNSVNGEVGNHTTFYYHQKGNIIWADYSGDAILKGYLIGNVDTEGNLNFIYQHLNEDHEMKIGKCHSKPILLTNGKIEIHERWKWLNGDESEGESILIEK